MDHWQTDGIHKAQSVHGVAKAFTSQQILPEELMLFSTCHISPVNIFLIYGVKIRARLLLHMEVYNALSAPATFPLIRELKYQNRRAALTAVVCRCEDETTLSHDEFTSACRE